MNEQLDQLLDPSPRSGKYILEGRYRDRQCECCRQGLGSSEKKNHKGTDGRFDVVRG